MIHLEYMAAFSFHNDKNEIQTEDVKIRLNERSNAKNAQKKRCCPCFCCSDPVDIATPNIRAIKILVLGPGGSGKSTVLKQMRIIHGEKFHRSEQQRFKLPIIKNIFQSISHLVDAMNNKFYLTFKKKENLKYYQELSDAEKNLLNDLNDWNENREKYVSYIKSIWNDLSIQECYSRKNLFYLHDSAKYFIEENLDRIGKADYIPEIKDILRVREPTTAIIEHKFKIKDTDFLFVDVGGQRSERRKWISCFESVSNIMFVASLSDYDLHLTNDELRGFQKEGNNSFKQINRLKEALDLFRTIINLRKPIFYTIKDTNGKEIQRKREELLFRNVGIILFLNKKDLFDEKILRSPLKTCFSEFDDQKYKEEERADAAKEFIAKKFTDFVEQDRNFYCHFTYALDRESMAVVIEAVRTQILVNVLRNLRY